MVEAKHTPGPWVLSAQGLTVYGPDRIHVTATGRSVTIRTEVAKASSVGGHSDQRLANARLIAAAPDLLEALQWVMSAHGEQLHDAFDAAHKAIAKAQPHDGEERS